MVERAAVLPAALNALVTTLCHHVPDLADTLLPDVDRFSQKRMASGLLSAAFNTSLLAYNGCPLEFTTSSVKPQAVACTFDTFLPLSTQARDIGSFSTENYPCTSSDSSVSAASCFTHIAHIQQLSTPTQTLKFGSWLGRKYAAGEVKTKVYSEIPRNNQALIALYTSTLNHANSYYPLHQLTAAGLSLLMIGYYPDRPDAPTEYYYQWHSAEITLADIASVMRFFGTESKFPPLAALLSQALANMPNSGEFPITTYGFSLVYSPQRQLESFSLFTMAPRFLGDNTQAAQKMSELLQHVVHPMPLLQVLIKESVPLQFNVIGFTVDAQATCGISCTFSPQNDRWCDVPLLDHSQPPPCDMSLDAILQQQQSENGAFLSNVRTPDGQWHLDANAFVTAQVLRTLDYNEKTAPYIDRALDFLATCETRPGHFGFWPRHAHPPWMKSQIIDADIDDTAIITEMLYKFERISSDAVRQTLIEMNGYQLQKVDARLTAPQHQWAECQTFHTWMRKNNEITQIDCCVNTNVLILLYRFYGEQCTDLPAYYRISTMLKKAVIWSKDEYQKINQLTPYYAHPAEWLATLEYAKNIGIDTLSDIITPLKKWQFANDTREIPLYRRHDGQYLWTSSYLSTLRRCSALYDTKDTHEHISQ
ncbi:hypothetical protein EXT66_06120 [Pectobacterium carotovorum subsp. carotovorum]|nr:hypothetical protein [Pectobacterium carotovorum]MCL6333398.1 hypothetical protein [Pectobacterium carotovorum subsp. carotovorum]MCL6345382.1 hypothetical protein [Pectobacterium carotovorum subsp. carotovorum]MCL6400857.1 hypothetical protein [Pectobacterium carotovorum subsp. carotovorum]